ncbi:hypothetical protein GBA52_026651 [Prunus armeniaca]|nr:hypothetical protein GBA52_026651 [Prunus armeniaca]
MATGIPYEIERVSDMESKAKYKLLCGSLNGFCELAKDKVDDTFSCILSTHESPPWSMRSAPNVSCRGH